MNQYNAAFFGLYENVFLTLKEKLGENEALSIFNELMYKGLSKSYGKIAQKGNVEEFKKLVGERDNMVGLKVSFDDVTPNSITYRFHDDPFPNLKGHVDFEKLVATFIPFKIAYILGDDWTYKTTKHLWNGDEYTEHVITKKAA